ncbi:MAG: hypothetical protein QOJ07_3706, partial [Thermoleophilaceae bacterium]|nr:hypothetical protein [Thermoleophilaceae bacterium]
MSDLRIGIDAGAATIGAVAVDRHGRLLVKMRAPSTHDLGSDVAAALTALVADRAVDPARVRHVMLSTPQIRSALDRRDGLGLVATIRIGA